MSDGKSHTTATIVLATGFTIGAIVTQNIIPFGYACTSLLGIFISCDLDVNKSYIGNSIIKQRLGCVANGIWRGFWMLYSKSFSHASIGSHFPIISTIIRLLYIWCWIALVCIVLSLVSNLDLMPNLVKSAKIILFNPILFIGLMSTDILHWGLDVLTKEKQHERA